MEIIDKFFSLIAPLDCVACQKEGDIVCEDCLTIGLTKAQSACAWCTQLTTNYEVCVKCRPRMLVENVWRPFVYGGFAKDVVSAYKFQSQRSVADFMVREMLEVLPENNFLVTSIPTANQRVRERGFDHALRLGKRVASFRHLPYQKTLLRVGTSRQLGSNKSARLKQAENLFLVSRPELFKDQNVLIVDDVMTTGATIASAARMLKKAGARSVSALVFARK